MGDDTVIRTHLLTLPSNPTLMLRVVGLNEKGNHVDLVPIRCYMKSRNIVKPCLLYKNQNLIGRKHDIDNVRKVDD